jgi:spermidine/putrescine transport system substrate-binding protein
MDVIDQLNAVRHGTLSRRTFNRTLLAAGVGIVATSWPRRNLLAQSDAQGTYFTYGGYDIPELFVPYEEKNGALPNLVPFGAAEDALIRMRAGFTADVSHPCNSNILRWVETGLFRPIDTARLSNWPDVIPELVDLEGNQSPDGPWMAPFDWGQTSITYRTDLFELEGEESWDMLWDERYAGRLGSLGSGGEVWWPAAIKAGVDFQDIDTDEAFDRIAAVLREQRPLIRTYTDDTSSLEQALAAGELVAAMTWNASATQLKAQGVPVRFAQPKEGALTWVCGAAILRDAPNLDRAYDIVDSLLSVESGQFMIGTYGYGHSNLRSFDAFDDETLSALGLSRDPMEILKAGHFQTTATQEWQDRMNETWEQIRLGF